MIILTVSEDEDESESDSSSESDGHSRKRKYKSKKTKNLIPRPYGTAGKKGTGKHKSKGYNLVEHMGLEG